MRTRGAAAVLAATTQPTSHKFMGKQLCVVEAESDCRESFAGRFTLVYKVWSLIDLLIFYFRINTHTFDGWKIKVEMASSFDLSIP